MPCWGHPEPAGLPPHNALSPSPQGLLAKCRRASADRAFLRSPVEFVGVSTEAYCALSLFRPRSARPPPERREEPYGRRYTRYFARRSSKKRAITISKRTAAVP